MIQDASFVFLPATLTLSIAILVIYGFVGCCLWSKVIIKRPVIGFAVVPWWIVVIFRVLQAVFGIVSSVSSAQTKAYHGHFNLIYTYLWDAGLCFIAFALLRAASFTFRVKALRGLDICQHVWITVVFGSLTIGTIFAGLQKFGPSSNSKYDKASSGLLRAWLCIVSATLLALIAPFGYIILACKPRRHSFSSADLATAMAFFPTLVLLGIRLGPDTIRFWQSQSPSLPIYIGLELVTELLVIALWISLAMAVTRWHWFRDKELQELRAEKKTEWSRHLDDAISYSQAVQIKGADMTHRQKPSILRVLETRFRSDEKHIGFLTSDDGRKEAVTMLQRLRVVAVAIAENLELDEELRQPLLKKPNRTIDMKTTEQKVVEALAARDGMTRERAAKVAREWVIIFVLDWKTFQPQAAS